jgi:hypothetical protein
MTLDDYDRLVERWTIIETDDSPYAKELEKHFPYSVPVNFDGNKLMACYEYLVDNFEHPFGKQWHSRIIRSALETNWAWHNDHPYFKNAEDAVMFKLGFKP